MFCIFLVIILRIITAQKNTMQKNSGGLNFWKYTPLIIDHQIWNHSLRWSIFYAGLQIFLFTLPVTLPRPTQLYIFKSPVPDGYLHLTKPAELTEPTELVCYALWTIVMVTLPSLNLIDNLAKSLCLLNCLWLDIYFFPKLCIIVSPSFGPAYFPIVLYQKLIAKWSLLLDFLWTHSTSSPIAVANRLQCTVSHKRNIQSEAN